jgi:hypothetical protein
VSVFWLDLHLSLSWLPVLLQNKGKEESRKKKRNKEIIKEER